MSVKMLKECNPSSQPYEFLAVKRMSDAYDHLVHVRSQEDNTKGTMYSHHVWRSMRIIAVSSNLEVFEEAVVRLFGTILSECKDGSTVWHIGHRPHQEH